ncbi:phosphate ABC transporter substrate-binding protein [Olsenella sp. YH-ols2217]|uniref:Phosphate ABC transporter substrate-binding protein n=1 Tax=Kribbibacterium absianum TaxID=3044210 RepID=A0ABT6ZKG5_9ACTN|nr:MULTISPECIES: phosphate ABC transporter substrate-binding protein [unclassified Olsenella]MDJ1122374.1 phosphate ABC transporter substrate-binding protein [Olsenella sp. YH-ols2216]MDJ1129372.1 phosphate ABC transporter substrate-binding protein [Olsenella sp. YH-ols2217]
MHRPAATPLARLLGLFCCALCAVTLMGCNAQKAPDTQAPETQAEQTGDFKSSVMFCGSTSLYPIISSLAGSFTDEYVTWDKANAELPDKDISIYVAPGGSGVGVSALEDGTCDFGMLARDLKDEEKQALGDYKVYEVAKDALTVSVNAQNPITLDDLSTDTIAQIFSGELSTWNQVDPSLPAEPIQVFIRDLSGGAYEVFQKTVMGDKTVTDTATQSASMTELATNIANNPWAIGYAGFGAYNKANADGQVLRALKVDGVEPTEQTIVSGEYKIQRPVMFVGKGDPTPAQQAFIDYVFSQTGKEVVEQNGYIPSFTPAE